MSQEVVQQQPAVLSLQALPLRIIQIPIWQSQRNVNTQPGTATPPPSGGGSLTRAVRRGSVAVGRSLGLVTPAQTDTAAQVESPKKPDVTASEHACEGEEDALAA